MFCNLHYSLDLRAGVFKRCDSMLIPKLFKDMIQAGAAFSLTITDCAGKQLTYRQRKVPGKDVPLLEVEEDEVETVDMEESKDSFMTLFAMVREMNDEQRDAAGVKLRKDGMLVNVKGGFAMSSGIRRYATHAQTFYVGPRDPATGRCRPRRAFFIPYQEGGVCPDVVEQVKKKAKKKVELPYPKKPLWYRKRAAAMREEPKPEPQHDEQHATGCPLAFPASLTACDPRPGPEVASD